MIEEHVNSGESRPVSDLKAIEVVARAAFKNSANSEFINRSIAAGKLNPISPGSDVFDPAAAVSYLASKITLPENLVAAVKRGKKGDKNALDTSTHCEKPWLIRDPNDPEPEQDWYTPARYFASLDFHGTRWT